MWCTLPFFDFTPHRHKHHAMNVPFYNVLLQDMRLSPTERIIYSYLLYRSMTNIEYFYDNASGSLDKSVIRETVERNPYITCVHEKQNYIAEVLGVSEKSVWTSLQRLDEMGITSDGTIYAGAEIILDGGYFPIALYSGLKGMLLILYSFLKNKSEMNGGLLMMSKGKIASVMNTTECGITKLLNRLYRAGLAERLPDNRLKIL